MARAIIGNTSLVILSEAELEEYGNEFEKLCHDSGRPMTHPSFPSREGIKGCVPMTFERFCLKKALDDEKILEARRYQESIWHLEVKRERRALAKKVSGQ